MVTEVLGSTAILISKKGRKIKWPHWNVKHCLNDYHKISITKQNAYNTAKNNTALIYYFLLYVSLLSGTSMGKYFGLSLQVENLLKAWRNMKCRVKTLTKTIHKHTHIYTI